MKQLLKVSEFAKLKNVTTETLRHYDRIGLLKPAHTDEETGYRYYTPFQSLKLATIIELRALGFSLEEIKAYFLNQHLKKSRDLLCQRHLGLDEEIKRLQSLSMSIARKIEHLDDVMTFQESKDVSIKHFEERKVIKAPDLIDSLEKMDFVASELENMLVDYLPVIGSNAYGYILPAQSLKGEGSINGHLIYGLDDLTGIDERLLYTIDAGHYACFYQNSSMADHHLVFQPMLKQIANKGYEIIGNPIVFFRIDDTVTANLEELLVEVQIPVKKSGL